MATESTPKSKSTRADVERELHAKTDQIEQRLASLQDEVASIGPSIQRLVFDHPLVGVGGALLAGLLVGLLVGGRGKSKDPFGKKAGHRALIDRYVDAVVAEARHRTAGGEEAGEAIREALSERVPLIVYEPSDGAASGGLLRQVAKTAFRLALMEGLKGPIAGLFAGAPPAAAPTDTAGGAAPEDLA